MGNFLLEGTFNLGAWSFDWLAHPPILWLDTWMGMSHVDAPVQFAIRGGNSQPHLKTQLLNANSGFRLSISNPNNKSVAFGLMPYTPLNTSTRLGTTQPGLGDLNLPILTQTQYANFRVRVGISDLNTKWVESGLDWITLGWL